MYKSQLYKIFILFFIGISTVSSQTILDHFTSVPDSSVLTLSKKERMKIVKYSKNNRSTRDARNVIQQHDLYYTFEFVDIPNGYLKLIGAMEGHLEMCLWNLQNGNKFIAVYHEACGPGCSTQSLNFYRYVNGKYQPVTFEQVFPDLYEKIAGSMESDGFREAFLADFKESLTFSLPRKGKNILAKWGSDEFTDENRSTMKGNRAHLIWKDGKFFTGEIFWAK